MSPAGLARLVTPRSVAIIGLSADPSKHGAKVLASLRRFGFDGPVWGVNPNRPEVEGVDVVGGMDELPEPPDAVVLAVPAAATPEVVRAAGDIGAGAAILFGGGFAEAGPDGVALQTQLCELAASRGVRLLGPNSAGVINPSAGTVLSFLTCLERPADELRPGPVGLVTQSGGTGSYLHNLAAERGSGFAISISTGNEADVDAAEALEQLVGMPDVRSVAVVLEAVRDGPRFGSAAAAALRAGKPIVVCKLGRSDVGQALMRTHTGALAGSERCYDAVFDALGITVTSTPDELFETAELMARTPIPAGNRIGVVTHSGGTAVLLADKAVAAGLSLPQPSADLRRQLEPYLQHGAAGNPTDLGGIITQPHRYAEVVRCFVDDPGYDLVVPVSTPHPRAHTRGRAEALTDLARETDQPLPQLWLAGDLGAEGLGVLREAGAAVTTDIDSLVHAVTGLARLAALTRAAPATTPGPDPELAGRLDESRPTKVALHEADSKRLLSELGVDPVPGRHVHDLAAAERVAGGLGYPVVLKAVSDDLPHKSDVGGVRTGLTDANDLAAAWERMADDLRTRAPNARIDGFLVERHLPGVEMIAGIAPDPTFGPMVLVGTGGTAAELVDDVAVGAPPLSLDRARRLIGSLRGRRALDGFRGAPPADVDALAGLLVRLAEIAVDYRDQIAELDLNPVVYAAGRWWIADALLRLHPGNDAG